MKNKQLPRRPRRSAADWADILKEFQTADQTQAEFCNQRNIGEAAFDGWRRKLCSASAAKQKRNAFVTLHVDGNGQRDADDGRRIKVEIRLQNDRSVVVHDVCIQSQLASLLQTVEGITPC